MRKIHWLGVVVLLAGAFFLCTIGIPSAQAADRSEIVIGTNLPMTGMLAGAGKEQKWSYDQAVADINAKGGIFVKEYGKKLPVKLVIADDESNAGKAGKAVASD